MRVVDLSREEVVLHRGTTHNVSEDLLSILELRNAIIQELSFALAVYRLRCNRPHLRILQATNGDRIENLVQAADHMAFNDLCGDVGDESLLRDLDGGYD